MSSSRPAHNRSASAFATLHGVAARTPDGRPLFDDLNLAFGSERTGVVGRNGAGKTTLLRLVAGQAEPAEGRIARAGTIGWLAQSGEPEPDEMVADTLGVAAGLDAVRRVLAGEGNAEDLAIADWTLEDRLAAALTDVGLSGLALDRPTAGLSGGEQTRLRLAGLMLQAPDLLVLDEPTNNLDAEGRALVMEVLARWSGGVVVVSHDRDLLRRMDRIVELSGLGAAVYGGGYDLYAERRDAQRAAAERSLESARRDVDRASRDAQRTLEKKARRDRAGRAFALKGGTPKILLGAMAERAENSGGRENRLSVRQMADAQDALTDARERVEQVRALDIPMPSTGLAAGRTVLDMAEASWSTPEGRRIVGPISLRITGPERIAVTGPNGAGKSTLLRLITGELEPTAGSVIRPVQAALMDQACAMLRPDETLLDAYRRLNPEAPPNAARAALARFQFRNTAAEKRVGELSGGERLRAALACVMTGGQPPQLLILDEPTNHLDLDSITAVETALNAYDGALIVVSHDEDFLEAVGVTRRIALRPGGSG